MAAAGAGAPEAEQENKRTVTGCLHWDTVEETREFLLLEYSYHAMEGDVVKFGFDASTDNLGYFTKFDVTRPPGTKVLDISDFSPRLIPTEVKEKIVTQDANHVKLVYCSERAVVSKRAEVSKFQVKIAKTDPDIVLKDYFVASPVQSLSDLSR